MTAYHGHIYGRIPATVSPVGRSGSWTCTHNHRQHSSAFECAVKRAKATVLKSARGRQSSATAAGIREITIGVKESGA